MKKERKMKYKILDLFSGLGGFSLGLERTGHFETIAFCDNDKFSKLILDKHWKGIKVYEDVREITKEKFKVNHFKKRRCLDIFLTINKFKKNSNVNLVINYDLPINKETYIHRIGRTARAASSGEATHFNVIGRALEDKNADGIGYVEAFVSIK